MNKANTAKKSKNGSWAVRPEPEWKPGRLPASLIEVAPRFVLAARLQPGPDAGLRRLAVKGLDSGVISPSPAQKNVVKVEALASAVLDAATAVGNSGGRAALLLPDGSVRVTVLDFETLPAKKKDRDELVRWKMKESLGFPVSEARISYQETFRAQGKAEVLAIAVHEDALAQYEAALEPVRGAPFLVWPATLALLPLLPVSEEGAQLLTHICSGWITHVVVENERIRFWRSRELGRDPASEAAAEAARAAASARDRMGLAIAKAWFCARPFLADGTKEALSQALGMAVSDLALNPAFEAGLKLDEKPLYAMFAAPAAGMIMNWENGS